MNQDDLIRLNGILRPVAQPRVLDGVYSADQYDRILDVIKRNGPWKTITANHFDSVEELMATSNGGTPDNFDLTLDDMATGHFRGRFAEASVAYFSELEDCFYNTGFLDLVRSYWDAQYARPQRMLFNLCGPHHSGLNAHLDAVTFRGVRMENSPVWLQNVMGSPACSPNTSSRWRRSSPGGTSARTARSPTGPTAPWVSLRDSTIRCGTRVSSFRTR